MSRRRILIPPLSILLFLALVLAGIYVVRRQILGRHLGAALDMGDDATIVELVNSFPCPVKARSEDRLTPLHWAAYAGRRDLVERLLSRGADLNAKDNAGATPPALGGLVREG